MVIALEMTAGNSEVRAVASNKSPGVAAFVESHPFRKVREKDGAPESVTKLVAVG